MKIFICLISIIVLNSTGYCAQPEAGQSGPDFVTMITRMVSALAIILGAMMLVLYLLKKIYLPRKSLFAHERAVRIVETLHLGPKKSVALIKAGEDHILLGLTSQSITFLSKIDIPDEQAPSAERAGSLHIETPGVYGSGRKKGLIQNFQRNNARGFVEAVKSLISASSGSRASDRTAARNI